MIHAQLTRGRQAGSSLIRDDGCSCSTLSDRALTWAIFGSRCEPTTLPTGFTLSTACYAVGLSGAGAYA